MRETVLKNINLKFKSGEKVAIVGESGSGKTTLIRLLFKYYETENGHILIDGYDIKDLQTQNLREKIGYVPQDIILFSGSIKDNISYGHKNVSFDQIVNAAKLAQAHDFINDFPLRYKIKVGERGSTLSGGQKQRIALARVILHNPDILILDEATSSLDTISEKAIHKTIDEISKDMTTIIIAHRLSTIIKCDKIIVLENGEVLESGSHEKLIDKMSRYHDLWKSQSLV